MDDKINILSSKYTHCKQDYQHIYFCISKQCFRELMQVGSTRSCKSVWTTQLGVSLAFDVWIHTNCWLICSSDSVKRWHLVLYLSSVEALEEDHSYRPDIHLVGDLRWLLTHHKTLWREVPRKHTHATHGVPYWVWCALSVSSEFIHIRLHFSMIHITVQFPWWTARLQCSFCYFRHQCPRPCLGGINYCLWLMQPVNFSRPG